MDSPHFRLGFDDLLRALDPDRECAALAFEDLRSRLANFFRASNCDDEYTLADTTIDRLIDKTPGLGMRSATDVRRLTFGFAKNIRHEYFKRNNKFRTVGDEVLLLIGIGPAEFEPNIAPRTGCLRKCLADLSDDERRLVLSYYSLDGQKKIDLRKKLATELGITLNHLRAKICRLKNNLRSCILRCVSKDEL